MICRPFPAFSLRRASQGGPSSRWLLPRQSVTAVRGTKSTWPVHPRQPASRQRSSRSCGPQTATNFSSSTPAFAFALLRLLLQPQLHPRRLKAFNQLHGFLSHPPAFPDPPYYFFFSSSLSYLDESSSSITTTTTTATMFRTAVLRTASVTAARRAVAAPSAVRSFSNAVVSRRVALPNSRLATAAAWKLGAIRTYAAGAGLSQSDVEGRIISILSGFDKVSYAML